jgi:predicted translin family RNA/ssDNA-binding protein
MSNINEEILKLKQEIAEHSAQESHHGFQAKAKAAKVKKLEKQLEKLNEIINEPLPPAV